MKNSISELLVESSQFNTNDVLVDVQLDNSKICVSDDMLTFNVADFPKPILREAEKTQKESGVNPLCLAEGIVQLTMNGKQVQTPIFLTPLSFSLDKIRKRIDFIPVEDDLFINPFLMNYLVHDLQASVFSDTEFIEIKPFQRELTKLGLIISDDSPSVIGNFHHHRYQVIKELEELLELKEYSKNLSSLFGFEAVTENVGLNLPPDNLFPTDTDHEKVFDQANNQNLVIQGPPGTGKSQVLTNVIGKLLSAHKTTIVVSEKRVALEVIKNKLSAFGLDKFCFIATSDYLSHSFLQELKSTWDYFESYKNVPVNNMRLSEQYEANLQMTLDLLSQKDLIGGVSFHTFKELTKDMKFGRQKYSSRVPDIDRYLSYKSTVALIYEKGLNAALGQLKKSTISNENFTHLDGKLIEWVSALQKLSKTFDFSTWDDFQTIMKEAIQCQIYENDLFKKYTAIFEPQSKAQKQFLSLRKKYLQARLEVEQINANHSHWKIVPSESETKNLLHSFQKDRSFFNRIKAKRRWKNLSHLPASEAVNELTRRSDEIAKMNNYSQIVIKFCEIGVDHPEIEVALIHQTLGLFSEDQWKALEEIPQEKRLRMTSYHAEMNTLYHDLKSHFNFVPEEHVIAYLTSLQTKLSDLIPLRDQLKKLDENTLIYFSGNATFSAFEEELYQSHWVRFKERFPAYSTFSMNDIHTKVNAVISAQEMEAKLFSREIENGLHKTFKSYHALLNLPARKLSNEQKELKAQLRKGKSILVKEFAKTRSHPSLRELYNSEAREWIQLLKPIWLSNPTQLAKCFPLESDLFDVAIFDEASQIPLQNAIGTIQRSARILVAGDEHQMGPSAYFKSGSAEAMDLLHQASYNWQKVALQHHYRSAHPDLIAFSNKHFYDSRLKAYPSNSEEVPIRHHYIAGGKFIDRKNEIEAKHVAEAIEKTLGEKVSIGIVAFSEEQLNCIWTQLSPKAQQNLTDKLEKNQGFFKALENVQGDECDRLIISFGYGPNEDNDFHMRFGPMNTVNGRKRINVLLTRAIKSIEFFCSVRSSDFKLSDNESINLLRQWISFSENYSADQSLTFPFGLQPTRYGNQLSFAKIHETLPLAQELVTLERVIENRGWKVKYS